MTELPEINPNCSKCHQLLKAIVQQQKVIEQLTARVEKLERESKRQAAPFRKPRKLTRKKPGRKPGDQYGEHRRRIEPERIDESYDVPLPEQCKQCGSTEITASETVTQYQIEIPQTVIHRQFSIEVGCCEQCGCRVQGRHELQTSDAVGAANVQFGAKAHAAMALLNKELGLSHGKVQRLMKMLFGIHISRSTSCRSVLRTGRKLTKAYEQIGKDVKNSPQVVGDETGWRIDGETAWLHVFVGLSETYYTIDATRSGGPAMKLLGKDWAGILGHDGWSVYDAFVKAKHQQCNAHLLRRCEKLIDSAKGGAVHFPRSIKALLLQGLEYRDAFRQGEISEHGLKVVADRLHQKLISLTECIKQHAGNERLAKFLWNHSDSIFTYLRHWGADATNWRGEQAIRPAVVNRKVWGGNRTDPGAEAQSIIMSVFQTCMNRSVDPFEFIGRQINSTIPLLIPLPVCTR